MTDLVSQTELEAIGHIHVTFRYPTAQAARVAWERAEKRCRRISVWRYIDPRTRVNYVTACGEDQHEVDKARRLLADGGELCESPSLETIRNRRRHKLIELALTDDTELRSRVRYGNRGALAMPDGSTILRPGQG